MGAGDTDFSYGPVIFTDGVKEKKVNSMSGGNISIIPNSFENTALLAALTHPNHIVYLCSWGSLICRLPVIPMALGIVIERLFSVPDLMG